MSCITGVSRFRRGGVNSRSAEHADSEIGFIEAKGTQVLSLSCSDDRCNRLHQTDMNREQVITALRGHEAELHRFGVSRLFLFGSVARDEAGPETDGPSQV